MIINELVFRFILEAFTVSLQIVSRVQRGSNKRKANNRKKFVHLMESNFYEFFSKTPAVSSWWLLHQVAQNRLKKFVWNNWKANSVEAAHSQPRSIHFCVNADFLYTYTRDHDQSPPTLPHIMEFVRAFGLWKTRVFLDFSIRIFRNFSIGIVLNEWNRHQILLNKTLKSIEKILLSIILLSIIWTRFIFRVKFVYGNLVKTKLQEVKDCTIQSIISKIKFRINYLK